MVLPKICLVIKLDLTCRTEFVRKELFIFQERWLVSFSFIIRIQFRRTYYYDIILSSAGMLEASTGSANSQNFADGASISLPPELFNTVSGGDIGLAFMSYNTSTLFPLSNDGSRSERFSIASSVTGATVAGQTISDLPTNITVVQRIQAEVPLLETST